MFTFLPLLLDKLTLKLTNVQFMVKSEEHTNY